jgi:hypothetical protein
MGPRGADPRERGEARASNERGARLTGRSPRARGSRAGGAVAPSPRIPPSCGRDSGPPATSPSSSSCAPSSAPSSSSERARAAGNDAKPRRPAPLERLEQLEATLRGYLGQPALTERDRAALFALGHQVKKAAASVEGCERLRWRREIEGAAGEVGRRTRTRVAALAAERELERIRREKQGAVVDEGRREEAPAWARIRAAWAAKASPFAWRAWLEPLRFVSSAPGDAGELVLELEAASRQALEVLGEQLEQLQEPAAAALRGRRVVLRFSAERH